MVEKEECKEYFRDISEITRTVSKDRRTSEGKRRYYWQTKKLTRILDVGSRQREKKKTWYRLIKTGLSGGIKGKQIYGVYNDGVEYNLRLGYACRDR